MSLPELTANGTLLPGLHTAGLSEVEARFGSGSEARVRQFGLLSAVVAAARSYETIKRVLIWGSFVTAKPEPNDLDYSLIVSVNNRMAEIQLNHRRFLSPLEARQFYGVDKKYLVIRDYPLEEYLNGVDFLRWGRDGSERGVLEINLRGEFTGGDNA